MTMQKPVMVQMPTKIRAALLVVEFTSHATGSRPNKPRIAFSVPVCGVARWLVVEHELPDDRRGDGADRHRQEDRDLGQRLVAHPVEEDGDDQAEGDADRGVEDEPQQAVAQRRQGVREREEVVVVGQADPFRVVTVAEADDDGAKERIDHENRRESDRGQRPEVRPDPSPESVPDSLSRTCSPRMM